MNASVAAKIEANSVLPQLDRAGALAAAKGLSKRIHARAERADNDRKLPGETIAELNDAGLFAIATPKTFGGSGLGFASLVEVASEIGGACGSSGWVYGVISGHNWMLSLFPEEAQREVHQNPLSLTATVFRLAGETTAISGGYRMVGGEGRFCSGVDFADWVIVGNAVKREDKVEPAFFLLPISDVEIVDDWFTAGMRGTGSRTIRIADAFIPEHRMLRIAEIQRGETPGAKFHGAPAYRLPTGLAQPFLLIGAPLGMARGAIADFAAAYGKRYSGYSAEQLGEQSPVFARLAQASADVEGAYRLIMDDCEALDASEDPAAMTPVERAKIKRDMAYAAQKCRYAVTSLFEAGGGSGIYNGSDMQRIWRDVNAATAHVAFTWDVAAANYGRALMGLPASRFTPV